MVADPGGLDAADARDVRDWRREDCATAVGRGGPLGLAADDPPPTAGDGFGTPVVLRLLRLAA